MKELKLETNILGYYQLIGGLLGLYIVAAGTYQSLSNNNPLSFLLLATSIPFLFSCYTGILCIQQKKPFILFSKINQLLQLVSVGLAGLTYTYCAGFFIHVGFNITESFQLLFNFGTSTLNIMIDSEGTQHFLLINLVAFIILRRLQLLEERIAEMEGTTAEEDTPTGNEQVLDSPV